MGQSCQTCILSWGNYGTSLNTVIIGKARKKIIAKNSENSSGFQNLKTFLGISEELHSYNQFDMSIT